MTEDSALGEAQSSGISKSEQSVSNVAKDSGIFATLFDPLLEQRTQRVLKQKRINYKETVSPVMDRLKKFFKDNKTKKNFKKAGPGRRLADSASCGADYRASPSVFAGQQQYAASKNAPVAVERIASADVAAQAAYKRMNLGTKQESATQRNIRMKALRELEKEHQQDEETAGAKVHVTDERTFEHSNAIQNVYFSCELFGEDVKMTKKEVREQVEEFLRAQLDSDAVVASCLMIFSLNGEKRHLASETLQKYIKNLIEHPEEPKYRRIRMSNKAFQDRVLSVKGGLEFLISCGFVEKLESSSDAVTPENFLVISEEKANDCGTLMQALEVLQTGEPVPLKLHRDAAVFKTDKHQRLVQPDLSPDFFQLSNAELKREQATKTLEAERMLSLRTQEMRIRDETLRHYTYNYTLIRIRFPNDFFLQGTFGCYEKFTAIREFILDYIVETELPLFFLKDPVTGKVVNEDAKTLGELNLAPAIILNFEWDPEVLALFAKQGCQVQYLREIHMVEAEFLS